MSNSPYEEASYEHIPETTVTVLKDPTNLWILNDLLEPEDFRAYEQWEVNRHFTAKAIYHHPSGARFYMKNIDDPFGIADEDTDAFEPAILDGNAKLSTNENLYTWVKGDTIWLVATRLGIPAQDLLIHNDIDDPKAIKPGTILHLPYPKPDKPTRATRIDILPVPQAMHTRKDTRKYNFGNAKTWEDMNTTGFWPQHTNVTILAIAYVPLTENGKDIEAGYYLDAMSLGDYQTSGKVRYTTGFSHNDLAPGHVDKSAPAPVAEKAMALTPEELEAKKSEVKQLVADEAAEHPDKYPNFFKSTYQPNSPFEEYTVILPKDQEYILVEDYDPEGSRNPVKLRRGREIFIAGTFEHGGATYGRPAVENKDGEHVVSRHWYGIPMDYLESNKELYNELEKRQLPWLERNFWVPLAKTYYGPTVQKFVSKNKKKG